MTRAEVNMSKRSMGLTKADIARLSPAAQAQIREQLGGNESTLPVKTALAGAATSVEEMVLAPHKSWRRRFHVLPWLIIILLLAAWRISLG